MSTMPPKATPATEISSADLLPEIVWNVDEFVEDGPVASLEIHLFIDPRLDRKQLPRHLASFVRAMSHRESALGGSGMILDRDECEVKATSIALLLRCLDVRHSQFRLEQLANDIQALSVGSMESQETTRNDPELLDKLVIEIAQGDDDREPALVDSTSVAQTISMVRVRTARNVRRQLL